MKVRCKQSARDHRDNRWRRTKTSQSGTGFKPLNSFAQHPANERHTHTHCQSDKCVEHSRFLSACPLAAPPGEPVCPAWLPRRGRRKARRHHFDCSSQPQHCRSTVCQAHTLLVSKISHTVARRELQSREHTHTHAEHQQLANTPPSLSH